MRRVFLIFLSLFFISNLAFAELTLEETQELFANPQKLYEPPNQEYNMEGYYYPAVDISKLWQQAGIKPQVLTRNTNEFLFQYKVGGPKQFILRYPETKLYSSDTLKILQIGSSSGAVTIDYQFLLFRKEKDRWVYFDYLYALSQNYSEPLIAFLENDLFYINKLGGYGTNIIEYLNVFYTLSDSKLLRLLELPDEGQISSWGMFFNRKYTSEMNYSQRILTVNYTIEIEANTYYYEPKHFKKYKEFPLFTVKRKVVFIKEGDSLKLDTKKSQLSLNDLDNLFNGGKNRYYTMFKKEFDKLKEGDAKEREWYKIFIESLNQKK